MKTQLASIFLALGLFAVTPATHALGQDTTTKGTSTQDKQQGGMGEGGMGDSKMSHGKMHHGKMKKHKSGDTTTASTMADTSHQEHK